MFIKQNKGQSILEYAILLGVVIAALLIMQVFVKRGYQGGLKDSADKMGEQFSGGGTSLSTNRNMTANQVITEEVATNDNMDNFIDSGDNITGTLQYGTHSFTKRAGGNQTMETKVATDSAQSEKVRWGDYENNTISNFNLTEF